jgi:hypothetical protein
MSLFEIVTGVLVALAGIAGLIFMPPVWAGYLSRRETRFRNGCAHVANFPAPGGHSGRPSGAA